MLTNFHEEKLLIEDLCLSVSSGRPTATLGTDVSWLPAQSLPASK